jgi:hypothetical protein
MKRVHPSREGFVFETPFGVAGLRRRLPKANRLNVTSTTSWHLYRLRRRGLREALIGLIISAKESSTGYP